MLALVKWDLELPIFAATPVLFIWLEVYGLCLLYLLSRICTQERSLIDFFSTYSFEARFESGPNSTKLCQAL
jgi:hypothetical protein